MSGTSVRERGYIVPSPSCPTELLPQQRTPPVAATAQAVDLAPAEIADHLQGEVLLAAVGERARLEEAADLAAAARHVEDEHRRVHRGVGLGVEIVGLVPAAGGEGLVGLVGELEGLVGGGGLGLLELANLFPVEPIRDSARFYRRWAFESAALDLALRQSGLSLHDAVGRPARPLNFVASLRLGEPPTLGMVRERLGPRVAGDAKAWLEARTQPIS